MTTDILYIAAYDVRNSTRLQTVFKVLRNYALGRQKSVFECPLKRAQKDKLLSDVENIIDPGKDRFTLIKLDSRCTTFVLGKAIKIDDEQIFFIQ